MWKKLRQPLSSRQMIAVVMLVGLTGASTYGLYCGAAALWHRRMLDKAIPAALAGVRVQREAVVSSIEAYRAHFGFYPPLHTGPGPNRGFLNPLCYELIGVQFEPRKATFRITLTKDPLTVDDIQKYFNMRSFSNCVASPDLPVRFLPNQSWAVSPLTKDGNLFGVGLNYTDFTAEEFWADFDFSPWRYVTNPAEHNPDKFDLWIEIEVAGKHFTIGNWPEVK